MYTCVIRSFFYSHFNEYEKNDTSVFLHVMCVYVFENVCHAAVSLISYRSWEVFVFVFFFLFFLFLLLLVFKSFW